MSAPSSPDYDLADITGFRISLLSNRLTLWAHRVYSHEFGIAPLEWRVLAAISALGQTTATDIVALTLLDKSNVSRGVTQLMKRKLVERCAHQRDRRKKVLSLTSVGREMHDRIAVRSLEREHALFEGWPPAERRQFLAQIARLDVRMAELLEKTVV